MQESSFEILAQRFLSDFCKLIIAFLLATPLLYLVFVPVNMFYSDFLCERFPETFKIYNEILESQQYQIMSARINAVVAYIASFIISWLVAVYSVEKRDEVFAKTAGFYYLKDGWSLYLRSYFVTDFISAVAANAVFFLAAVYIPDTVGNFNLSFFMAAHKAALAVFSPVNGFLLAVLVMILAKIPAMFFAVRRWRGELLSHLVEI